MSKGRLSTVISLDSTKFRSGLRAAQSAVSVFGRGMKRSLLGASKSLSGLRKGIRKLGDGKGVLITTARMNRLIRVIQRGTFASLRFGRSIERSFFRASLSAQRFGVNMAKVSVILGGVAAILALKKSIDAAASVEVLDVAFTSLTGNVTTARQSLRSIENQALATGVSMEVQADAVQKFLALGFDPKRAIRLQQSILDVSGAMGLTAFQAGQLGFAISQVAAKGVVQMEELRQQISEKGVPIFEALSVKTGLWGLELQKAVKDGKIGAEVLLEIFENYEGPFARFRGGAERLGNTFTGTINRMKEAVKQLFRDIGKPIIKDFKRVFDVVFRFLRGARTEARKVGEFLARGFKRAAIVLETILSLFRAGVLGDRLELAMTHAFDASVAALKIGLIKLAPTLMSAFQQVASGIGFIIDKVVSKEFGGAILDSFMAAGKILVGFGDIVRSKMGDGFNKFVAILQSVGELIPLYIRDAMRELEAGALRLGAFLSVHLGRAVESMANGIASVLKVIPGFGGAAEVAKAEGRRMSVELTNQGALIGALLKLKEWKQGKKIWEDGNKEFEDIVDKNLKANTKEALKASGEKGISEGVTGMIDAMGSVVSAITGIDLKPLEETSKKQTLELRSAISAIGWILGFSTKDYNTQRSQLQAQGKIEEHTKALADNLKYSSTKEGRINARVPENREDRRSDAQKASDLGLDRLRAGGGGGARLADERLGPRKEAKFPGLDFFNRNKSIEDIKESATELNRIQLERLIPPGGNRIPKFQDDPVVPKMPALPSLQDAQKSLSPFKEAIGFKRGLDSMRLDQLPRKQKQPAVGRDVGKAVSESQSNLITQMENIAAALQTVQLV